MSKDYGYPSFELICKASSEDEESVKKQSYYLSNLCGYSPNLHKPYKAYLEALDAQKNGDILGTKKKSDEEYAIDDLGWLNNL